MFVVTDSCFTDVIHLIYLGKSLSFPTVVRFCKTLKKGPKLGKSSQLWASPEFHQGKLNELSPKLLLKVPFNFPELVQFFFIFGVKTFLDWDGVV